MAHVKARKAGGGKWKPITIAPELMIKHDMDDLISMEELHDYSIGKDGTLTFLDGPKKKNKKKRNKKKEKKDESKTSALKEDKAKPKKKVKKERCKKKKAVVDIPSDSEDETNISESIVSCEKKSKNTTMVNNILSSPDDEEISEIISEPDSAVKKKRKADDSGQCGKKRKKSHTVQDIIVETKGTTAKVEKCDMSGWNDLFVPEPVLRALSEEGFSAPTKIQSLVLPHAIRDKLDIIGAAETGSGKTLAYAIPVIHRILQTRGSKDSDLDDISSSDEDSVSDASSCDESFDEVLPENKDPSASDSSGEDDHSELGSEDCDLPSDDDEVISDIGEDEIGCVAVRNNVCFPWLEEKSANRENGPLNALIVCPTRELAIQVKNHIQKAVKFLDIQVVAVVGGMAQQKQARLLKRCPEIVVATPGRLWELIQEGDPHLSKVQDIRTLVVDEADRMVEKGHFQELSQLFSMLNSDEGKTKRRQTFVFSATLTMIHSGPERMVKHKKKKNMLKTPDAKIKALMAEIGMKERPKVIDLTTKVGTAETLTEARITCTLEEKDLYLFYFIQKYPGRTLVFANSKDCIRRLVSICALLECSPLPLHADMHQKQRLKNLDRFTDNPRGLLLATDVAARGLDIPNVQHVIHYQVPRTTENYVHRSGRTARASKEGLSVMLVGPEDLKNYRKIIKTLNKDEDLPVFPTEMDILSTMKPKVQLARQIDKEEHQTDKVKVQNNWFLQAAKDIDMILDEDEFLEEAGDQYKQSQQKHKIRKLKMQLHQLLSEPNRNRSFSGKYPTKSGKLIIPESKDEASAVKHAKQDHKKTEKLKQSLAPKLGNKKKKYKKNKANKGAK